MRKKILALMATAGLAAGGLVAASSDVAEAAKVANPGAAQIRFDSGTLQIRDEVFEAGSSSDQVVVSINVQANGNFTISGMTFPDIPPIDGPLGDVEISISFQGGSGHVNPLTGAMNIAFAIRIDADGGGVGSNCHVGNINVNASTANSGGVPYNPSTGRVTLADHTFSVPSASGCTTFPVNVNDEINNELGLPSPSGQNHAVFSGGINPILGRAIVPAFTATPPGGPAPLPVTFDASSTFHTRPITSYQWDFDGNGSFDQTTVGPVAAFTYTTPGTRTVKLRVTDQDGDIAETTRLVSTIPAPDLVLAKAGPVSATAGSPTSFTVDVSNVGAEAATGTVTVTDALPAGFSFLSHSGSGWSCAPSGPDVVCTTDDDVAPNGGTLPQLTLDVLPDVGLGGGDVTNTATVAVAGDVNAANDTDDATFLLIANGIDLELTKVHDPDDGLFVGERATYVLSVANVGTVTAEGQVTLVDDLPDGVDVVSVAGGLDWLCSHSAGVVTCVSQEDVPAGASLDDVRIRVELTPDVVTPLTNTASVDVDGESNAANNTDSDTGDVLGYEVDYDIFAAQLGQLVVGEPGLYGIGVENIGTATGGGTVTVVDELPTGITFVGFDADGWSCGAAGQTVTCTHPGGVEGGDLLPGISLQVAVDAAAVPEVTNQVSVSGAGDVDPSNDGASLTSSVRLPQPDLAITKSHPGNFTTRSDGTYTITVTNLAPERADGPTVVTDTLPPGLDFVSAMGTGWACVAALPEVTCTYADPIPGLASAPPISLVVNPPDGAPAIVTNHVSVANAQDVDDSNDVALDPTRIDRREAIATTLEADAIVLGVKALPKLAISLLNAPYAVLEADGVPVPGKLVTFRTLGGAEICSATTGANGVATCGSILTTYLTTLGQLRYTAQFAGDHDYAGSDDEAAIIHINGTRAL